MNEIDDIIINRIDDLKELIKFNIYIGHEDRVGFLESEIKYLKDKL